MDDAEVHKRIDDALAEQEKYIDDSGGDGDTLTKEKLAEAGITTVENNLTAAEKEKKDSEEKEKEEDKDGWQDLLGTHAILRKVIRKGQGENTRPSRDDHVTIRLHGTLDDGTIVDAHDHLDVTVGETWVVPRIDLCLALMELNEIAHLKIEPRFAYGKLGRKPDVPPDALIIYEVEILKVSSPPNLDTLSVNERINLGNKKREQGNYLYAREDYNDAINLYARAIDALDDQNKSYNEPDIHLQELVDLRVKCYNNLAAAQLKVNAYEAAIKSCDNVLRIQPENVKALFRKGKVMGALGKTTWSIEILRKALKLEPETKIIHQELSRVMDRHRKEEDKQKAMYKRMLGTDKEEPAKSKFSYSKCGLISILGAACTAVLSMVLYRYMHNQ